jgi:peptide/nickel transport system permease protein
MSATLAPVLDPAVDAELVEPGYATQGYWEQAWTRLRRDRLAIAGAVFIFLLVAAAFAGAPLAAHLLGHGPNDQYVSSGIDQNTFLPVGPWSHVADTVHHPEGGHTTLFILGADSTLGRDEFLRLLYGARISLEVSVLATLFSMTLAVLLGSAAGYFRGWVDTVISRMTEITMAFPTTLFLIALASTLGQRINGVTFGGLFSPGVVTLVVVFSLFGWYFPARVVRAVVLGLREKEFVEAARMVGASDWRIIRSHVFPHLVAPVLVFSTIAVAALIIAEASLSFLGVGIRPPTPSWGNLLSGAWSYYTLQPWLMVWPGLAVLLTTLAFNLLGDGLRDALDPRSAQ